MNSDESSVRAGHVVIATAALGPAVPIMALLLSGKMVAELSKSTWSAASDLWHTCCGFGALVTALSTLIGAAWGAHLVSRGRQDPSNLLRLSMASGLPALSTGVYVGLHLRTLTALLGRPTQVDLVSRMVGGSSVEVLHTSIFGLVSSAILAHVLAGAVALAWYCSANERALVGAALFPLLGLSLTWGLWSIRLAVLARNSDALVFWPAEERLRFLKLAGQKVSWSGPALAVITLAWISVLVGAAAATRLRRSDTAWYFGSAAFGYAAFVLTVAWPRQAMSAGATAVAALQLSTSLVDFEGYRHGYPTVVLSGGEVIDARSAGRPQLTDQQITSRYAEAREYQGTTLDGALGVGVGADATAAALGRVVTAVAKDLPDDTWAVIELVGEPRSEVPQPMAPEFSMVAQLWRHAYRFVPLAVAGKRACANDCAVATIDGESLRVGSERWLPSPLEGEPLVGQLVLLRDPGPVAPEKLLAWATAAASHGGVLTVEAQ